MINNKLQNLPYILWINMERSKDRYNFMINQFNILNIDNHYKIDAYDAKLYDLDIKNNNFSYVAIFCGASHLKALLYFVNNTDKIGNKCLIMEDDLDIIFSINKWSKNYTDYLSIYNNINYDIIQLQTFFINKLFKEFKDIYNINIPYKRPYDFEKPIIEGYYGTACYLITLKRAKEILDEYNIKNEEDINTYILKYNDYKYFKIMKDSGKLIADHKLLYNKETYIMPIFYLKGNNDSNIGGNAYNDFQSKNQNRLLKYMKKIL